jgi:hypothetical protein
MHLAALDSLDYGSHPPGLRASCKIPQPAHLFADDFPRRAHNQSMNTLSSRVVPQSFNPLVPVLYPTPPYVLPAIFCTYFSRNTPDINQLIFLSVNYPVNLNPQKTAFIHPKGPALGAK